MAATTNTTAFRAVIDDGTREIPVLNKFGKLICNIYIRPADISIIDRYNDFIKDFDSILTPLADIDIANDGTADGAGFEPLRKAEAEVKQRINALFDMDEADDIFAKRNPFSSVGGRFFVEIVLEAIANVIEKAINEEAKKSQKRISKYLAPEAVNAGHTPNVTNG